MLRHWGSSRWNARLGHRLDIKIAHMYWPGGRALVRKPTAQRIMNWSSRSPPMRGRHVASQVPAAAARLGGSSHFVGNRPRRATRRAGRARALVPCCGGGGAVPALSDSRARARGHVWHHVPATRRPRHFHAEPELNLIAAGQAVFGVGEAIISVSTGDLLWWPPGQDHVLLDASPDLDLYVIGVTPAFSEHVLAESSFGGCCRRRDAAAARSRHAEGPADGVCRSDELAVIRRRSSVTWAISGARPTGCAPGSPTIIR